MPGIKRQACDPIDQVIGARIKEGRQQRHLLQKELALRIGVTHQQLQKYEAATDRVSASRLKRIADAMRLPVDFFYGQAGGDAPWAHAGFDADAIAFAEALASIPNEMARMRLLAFARGTSEDLKAAEQRARADTLDQLRRAGRIGPEAVLSSTAG